MIALEQLVAPDFWARVIDLFVDILPIDELGFKYVKLQSEGRPPYNPATLLKLYLYGYKHSIRSSRKLEHSCKVNVELWWLLNEKYPANLRFSLSLFIPSTLYSSEPSLSK